VIGKHVECEAISRLAHAEVGLQLFFGERRQELTDAFVAYGVEMRNKALHSLHSVRQRHAAERLCALALALSISLSTCFSSS
jgi:hypothetical protein